MALGDSTHDALARVPLFAHLTRRQRRRVASLATHLDVPAGSTLLEEGKPGNELVVVLSGTLEVSRDGAVIGSLGPGDCFGESALLDQKPRNATVRATTTATVEIVGESAFRQLCEDAPEIEATLRGVAAERAANRGTPEG